MIKIKASQGFTLIELIIVVVIMGIMGAVVTGVVQTGLDAYITSRGTNEASWQARFAFQRFVQDVSPLSKSSVISASSSQLIYANQDNATTTYAITSDTLSLNGNPLIESVDSANTFFKFYDEDLVELSSPLSVANLLLLKYVFFRIHVLGEGADQTLQTMIALRNN